MPEKPANRIVINDITGEIAEQICDKYCKYPDIWDEEKEGQPLQEAICKDCPLNSL